MLTKEEILEKMRIEMPFHLPERIEPYIEEAMDLYANQKAIQFAEWLSGEGYQQYDGKERWIAPQNNNNVYETKQLYEMFLKR